MDNELRDIGVVLCDCGKQLREKLDFERIQKYLEQLPEVTAVKLTSKFCRQSECSKVIKAVAKKQVKRLVIGACEREIFDGNLCEAMAEQGVNEGLLWCTNIREHCAWVTSDRDAATDKAIGILSASVGRTKLAEAVKAKKTGVNQNVLVLGSGVAAMQTAVGLSQLGHNVVLVHKGEKLGGMAGKRPDLYAYVAGDSCDAETLVQNRVDELIGQISGDKQIRVEAGATLESVEGQFGGFTAVLNGNGGKQSISSGAIVLATGGASSPLPGQLAQVIHNSGDVPRRIAIVIDVAGEQGRDVSAQVLSAAELLVKRFGAEVKLYCHNVRVASTGLEKLYRRAREVGVVIVKYDKPPVVSQQDGKKVVRVEEPVIGIEISEEFDLVIMADAGAGNGELLNLVAGLRGGPGGAMQYDNVWLLPTKTNREGIFTVGSARGNSEFRDAQADGLAAANQIHELLKNKQIEVLDDAAVVDEDKCVLCLTCMRICPYGAVGIDADKKTALISLVDCQRCGICAAQCPADAIQLPRYTDDQIKAELGNGNPPRMTVFACENSALPAATAAGLIGGQVDGNIRLIRVPCAGKVDARDVLGALEGGAEKVLVLSCHPENCQYLHGSARAEKRIKLLNSTLEKAGIDKKRVEFGPLASVEPSRFLEYVKE